MKKVLLLLLAGLMAYFGVSANAMAGSRLDSMGADVRQFDDQDVIWLYPNQALMYKNTADIRLNNAWLGSGYFSSTDDDYAEWGGMLMDAGDVGVVGAYLNRPSFLPNQYYSNVDTWSTFNARYWVDSTLYGQPFSPTGGVINWGANGLPTLNATVNPANLIDGFWAKNFGDISLGAVINYGDHQVYEANAGDDARTLGINAAAGFGAVGPLNSLNAHLGYQMGSVSNPSNNIADNGIYTIPFGLLGDINLDSNHTLRVFADGQMNQFSLKNITGPAYSEKNTNNHYLLGAAVNKKIQDGKGLVSGGLFYAYDDLELTNSANNNKFDQATWDMIANISLETPLSSWLTWRTGLTKMIFERWFQRTNGAAASYGDNWYYSDNEASGYSSLNTGFGVNVENWTLDATLSVQGLENFIGDPSIGSFVFGNPNAGTGAVNATPFEVVTLDAKYKF